MTGRYGYPVIGKRNEPGGIGSRPTGACLANSGNLLLATGSQTSWHTDGVAIELRRHASCEFTLSSHLLSSARSLDDLLGPGT
jgi:hypothetical protein